MALLALLSLAACPHLGTEEALGLYPLVPTQHTHPQQYGMEDTFRTCWPSCRLIPVDLASSLVAWVQGCQGRDTLATTGGDIAAVLHKLPLLGALTLHMVSVCLSVRRDEPWAVRVFCFFLYIFSILGVCCRIPHICAQMSLSLALWVLERATESGPQTRPH